MSIRRPYKMVLFVILNVALLWVVKKWHSEEQKLEGIHSIALDFEERLRARDTSLKEIEDYNAKHVQNLQHRLPKVIGIGIKKCGTGGVIRFLDHHPLVRLPPKNEVFFFTGKNKIDLNVYRKKMPLTNERQVAMEKTPVYFAFSPENNPERIKSSILDVKLILIVCDPTTRAFSEYVHEKLICDFMVVNKIAFGDKRKALHFVALNLRPTIRARYKLYHGPMMAKYNTFESFVDENLPQFQSKIEEWLNSSQSHSDLREKIINMARTDFKATILSNGIYSAHIQRWRNCFNETTLKIIDGNRFLDDPGSIIEELQDFIGIPKVLLREDFVRHPVTKFFCYRRFTEQNFKNNVTEQNNDKELIKKLQCLPKLKGRTRNGKQNAKDQTLEKLRAFYHPFNQQFFKDIKESFNWSQPRHT